MKNIIIRDVIDDASLSMMTAPWIGDFYRIFMNTQLPGIGRARASRIGKVHLLSIHGDRGCKTLEPPFKYFHIQ